MGLKCTVVTYGVLIKALMRSGKKQVRSISPMFPNDFYSIVKKYDFMYLMPGYKFVFQIKISPASFLLFLSFKKLLSRFFVPCPRWEYSQEQKFIISFWNIMQEHTTSVRQRMFFAWCRNRSRERNQMSSVMAIWSGNLIALSTHSLTHWLSNWYNDWLTDWLTDRSTDRPTDTMTNWTDWLYDYMTDWLNDWLSDWLIDWLNHWYTDCITGSSINQLIAQLLPLRILSCFLLLVFSLSLHEIIFVFTL